MTIFICLQIHLEQLGIIFTVVVLALGSSHVLETS